MVPGALRVSPARLTTATSGASDLGGASVVRSAAALAGGKGGQWRVQGRSWYAFLSWQVSRPLLRMWSTWKGEPAHASFISVSGAVHVAGASR